MDDGCLAWHGMAWHVAYRALNNVDEIEEEWLRRTLRASIGNSLVPRTSTLLPSRNRHKMRNPHASYVLELPFTRSMQ